MKVYSKEQNWSGTKKVLLTYHCGWCGYKFQQYVCKGGKRGDGKRGDVSDQVQCKQCGNFLKTWGEKE